MNNPSSQRIWIEDQRSWLNDYRATTNSSWSDLQRRTGIPQGTLSTFASKKYKGDEKRIADAVFRFRQTLVAQAQVMAQAPEIPGYFETETSIQLMRILKWTQLGRIVVAAMGAGVGKTTTARHYASCFSNVFLSTMAPSTAGVSNMQQEVLKALGDPNAVGTPQRLSAEIRERLVDKEKPLLIIDEAQHLSPKAIEEIRSWHDATRCGIALFGNESVLQQMTGGNRSASFAQLFSRISFPITRSLPLEADVHALADAWGVADEATRAILHKIVMRPGALRGGTMALELASMIASSEQRELRADDLQDAWAQISVRARAA